MEIIELHDAARNAQQHQPQQQPQQQPDNEPATLQEPRETFADRCANFAVNLYAKFLRGSIDSDRALIAAMPASVEAQKKAALRDYQLRLQEIDEEANYHVAQASLEIHRCKAKLSKMGLE